MPRLKNTKSKQAHSMLGDTAFPKINGKRDEFLGALNALMLEECLVGEVTMEGTVKLHGMHADIVFDILPNEVNTSFPSESARNPQGKIRFQSRNREVLPAESQNGWPKTVAYHVDALFELKRQILDRFQRKNPHLIIDTEFPLIIGGEWIGQKVQRDVGICQLSQRLVILAINVNGQWQDDADYADLEAPNANIYNIYRVPQYKVQFNLRMMQEENLAFEEMQQLANQVERCCPYAAAFGVPDSQGEGIVWKVGTPGGRAQASKWLKTKGPIASGIKPQTFISSQTDDVAANEHRKAVVQPKARVIGKKQNLNPTDFLAKRLVTDRRVEQGFEYLEEMCIDATSINNWRTLADWLVDDIFEEDKSELAELEKKYKDVPGFKFDVEFRKSITRIGRERYIERIALRKATADNEENNREKMNEADERLGHVKDERGKGKLSVTANPAKLSNDFQKWIGATRERVIGADPDIVAIHPAFDETDDAKHDLSSGMTTAKAKEVSAAKQVPPDIDQVPGGVIRTKQPSETETQTDHRDDVTNAVTREDKSTAGSPRTMMQALSIISPEQKQSRQLWVDAVKNDDATKLAERR